MKRPGITAAEVVVCAVLSITGTAGQAPSNGQQHRDAYIRLRSMLAGETGFIDSWDKCGLPVITQALRQTPVPGSAMGTALTGLLARQERQKSIVAGNFRIHYDTVGNNAPAMLDDSLHRIEGTADEFADSVAAIAIHVYTFETGILGYASPPADGSAGGGSEYDIYVEDIPAYGFTSPEVPLDSKPDGGRFTSSVTIDNDFTFVYPPHNRGLPALRVTLAHEFHHAIQIGSYGYWTGERYYLEITSVWVEDVVYTGVNDYYEYMRFPNGQPRGHFRTPEITFVQGDPTDILMYSRGIWGHFVTKEFGRDAMRRSWEHIRNVSPLQAIDNTLREYGFTFRTAFAGWSLWNYFTGTRADSVRYYQEGANYPLMTGTTVEFSSDRRQVDGSIGALSSKYYHVIAGSDTLDLIVSNLNFESALPVNTQSFPFSIILSRSRVDDTYKEAGAGVFTKLAVDDQSNWFIWNLYNGNAAGATTREGSAFPNPFIPGKHAVAFFPVSSRSVVRGNLTIFSSSMDLVYSFTGESSHHPLGPQTFIWNGRSNSNTGCPSGVYMFVIQSEGVTTRGKIALVREGNQ